MNKIGIITYHASHNCGSMLQAFALQNVLNDKFNAENEIIDFSNEGQQAMYKPFWRVKNIKGLIKNILWFTVLPSIKKQREDYINFSEKYFKLSKHSYSVNQELVETNNFYNKFITGSDQVWNISCMDTDDAYYLNFVEGNYRYAYATSFGAFNPFVDLQRSDYYKTLVNKFDRISVRESNAKKWVREATGKDVFMTLDPTMLLSQDEWENKIENLSSPIVKGDYVFYYCFRISQDIAKFLQGVSKKIGMPVYFLEPKEWALRCCWKNKIKLVNNYGPEAFLNLMKYSKLIFTTSFHGTAFSTIFKKDFWYIDSGKNDLSKDDRAVSFLKQLGLMERYQTIENLKTIDLFTIPDYTVVEEKLKVLKKESFDYLESIVNDK
ncbi:MAG: polysaccharide pyruvyl transferase family protein [Clostridium sp.]|nr:polysaccharide pyruvyl transferase family protein [Clostridium sp.]